MRGFVMGSLCDSWLLLTETASFFLLAAVFRGLALEGGA
jgi:hypothetical protein